VRTLDVAVDMGSLLQVVFVGCSCTEITHGEPSYPLVATSWPGSSRAGIGSRALDGDGCEQPPRAPATVLAHRPGAIKSPLVAC